MNTEELKAEVERLNSELTKARELLREGLEESKEGDDWIERVVEILGAHQSAPAAKGEHCFECMGTGGVDRLSNCKACGGKGWRKKP